MDESPLDLATQSEALDDDIAVYRSGKVFSKRATIVMFLILIAIQTVGYAVTSQGLRHITTGTREAVTHEVPGLKKQIADRDKTIADQTSIVNQEVDWILKLQQQIRDMGGEPPEIVIRPPDD